MRKKTLFPSILNGCNHIDIQYIESKLPIYWLQWCDCKWSATRLITAIFISMKWNVYIWIYLKKKKKVKISRGPCKFHFMRPWIPGFAPGWYHCCPLISPPVSWHKGSQEIVQYWIFYNSPLLCDKQTHSLTQVFDRIQSQACDTSLNIHNSLGQTYLNCGWRNKLQPVRHIRDSIKTRLKRASNLDASLQAVLQVPSGGVVCVQTEPRLGRFPHARVLVQPTLELLHCGGGVAADNLGRRTRLTSESLHCVDTPWGGVGTQCSFSGVPHKKCFCSIQL